MGPLNLMLPTHLAVGYLGGVYSRFPVTALVIGSALPDVVGRPLYWAGLTPAPHTVAHSLAVAIPVSLALIALAGRRGVALAIGWLVHIVTDAVNVLTTQGLALVPDYVLWLRPDPEPTMPDVAVTLELPLSDVGHTLHPVMLVVEFVVLCWALTIVGRRQVLDLRRSADSR
ncbi:hydrolase [Halopiger goleimassiliensis]|uniref:hydrolase n=1 Tax=Halopiger goleimassiliensis TaxID=1293048 RepID=UPI00067795F2|nr:hydrolase [Halopiger goleimassiliensis]